MQCVCFVTITSAEKHYKIRILSLRTMQTAHCWVQVFLSKGRFSKSTCLRRLRSVRTILKCKQIASAINSPAKNRTGTRDRSEPAKVHILSWSCSHTDTGKQASLSYCNFLQHFRGRINVCSRTESGHQWEHRSCWVHTRKTWRRGQEEDRMAEESRQIQIIIIAYPIQMVTDFFISLCLSRLAHALVRWPAI